MNPTDIIEQLLKTFTTGSGVWNPLVWGFVIIIALLLVYVLRGYGKREYKENTEQTKAFLSGNPEYTKNEMHVKGKNLYWGFTESLKSFYDILEKIHNGNTSDYVLWFVIVLGILFIVIGVI